MMRRCYQCKCLENESTTKYTKRTHADLKEKFFCKKCSKNRKLDLEFKRIKRICFSKDDIFYDENFQKSVAMGRFIRKCPEGCYVTYIIPFSKGGLSELENMKYETEDKLKKRIAKILTKLNKISKNTPSTHTFESITKMEVTPPKMKRRSKFRMMRRLCKNKTCL